MTKIAAFAVSLSFVAVACASEKTSAPVRVTSASEPAALAIYDRANSLALAGRCKEARAAYDEYAGLVRSYTPQKAEMALRYADDCIEPVHPDPITAAVSSDVVAGRDRAALALAPRGGSAWLDYNRAVAFSNLRRTDEAVAAYRAAEQEFREDQRWERSIAIYGRARALDDAARCPEAKEAYEEYASLVEATDPQGAEMAGRYARACYGAPRR
jgi:hypothetical protein